jgi:hypothetical protein
MQSRRSTLPVRSRVMRVLLGSVFAVLLSQTLGCAMGTGRSRLPQEGLKSILVSQEDTFSCRSMSAAEWSSVEEHTQQDHFAQPLIPAGCEPAFKVGFGGASYQE